jgi:hypothetical protein
MKRDGLNPAIMDGDHNLPAGAGLSDNQNGEVEEEDRPKVRIVELHYIGKYCGKCVLHLYGQRLITTLN